MSSQHSLADEEAQTPVFTRASMQRVLQSYQARIGYVVYHWNRLHEELARLFSAVANRDQPKIGVAIWFSTENDAAQRNMLRAADDKTTLLTLDQKIEIAWILNEIDKPLRFRRNTANHAPLQLSLGIMHDAVHVWVMGDEISESQHAKQLRQKDIRKHFKWCGDCCRLLAEYTKDIKNAVERPKLSSWPKKPKLPPEPISKGPLEATNRRPRRKR